MKTIATICARGGSKGVPGKNARHLNGEPLIARAVHQARRIASINAGVYVSTDDPELAELAESAGATVPFMRPAHLATDSAGKLPVIEHLCEHVSQSGIEFDRIVDLDPTCPLRSDSDVIDAIDLLRPGVDVVIGCTPSRKNPYFNMVEPNGRGYFELVKTTDSNPVSRQTAPEVFDITGAVYVWHRDTLKLGLWGGNTEISVMPPERSVDIDSELEFRLVELLERQQREQPDP